MFPAYLSTSPCVHLCWSTSTHFRLSPVCPYGCRPAWRPLDCPSARHPAILLAVPSLVHHPHGSTVRSSIRHPAHQPSHMPTFPLANPSFRRPLCTQTRQGLISFPRIFHTKKYNNKKQQQQKQKCRITIKFPSKTFLLNPLMADQISTKKT